jgi:ATP synthase F1 complex assembly factor 1
MRVLEQKRKADFKLSLVPRQHNPVVDFMFMEFKDDNCLFTPLADYKERGARAAPVLILRSYTDIAESKELVLMRGQIDPNRLTVHEAGVLANQWQLFYLSQEQFALVRQFNQSPEQFNVAQLLNTYLLPPQTSKDSSNDSNNAPGGNAKNPSRQQRKYLAKQATKK